MAINLDFHDAHVILNEVVSQAVGEKVTTDPVDTNTFIAVAQRGLAAGYDKLTGSISRVLGRTIFSARPYAGRFTDMMRTSQEWGAWTRKINYLWDPAQTDPHYDLKDGQSYDQYKVNVPKTIETIFSGGDTWMLPVTFFMDQLKTAFRGPEEFAAFMSGKLVEVNNSREVFAESMARLCLNNLMAGLMSAEIDPGKKTRRVRHLFTEYKAARGLSDLTPEQLKAPEHWKDFVQFAFSEISKVSESLKDMSVSYHNYFKIGGEYKYIKRHTPANKQIFYFNTLYKLDAEYLAQANTYHDNYLKLPKARPVTFWQNENKPTEINIKPTILKEDGIIGQPAGNVTNKNVMGVLFDEEAASVCPILDTADTTPYNALGRYYTTYYRTNYRYGNDFTENAVVFLMD